jgi:hypothetical protein
MACRPGTESVKASKGRPPPSRRSVRDQAVFSAANQRPRVRAEGLKTQLGAWLERFAKAKQRIRAFCVAEAVSVEFAGKIHGSCRRS